ncbi:MAG TPA: TrbC/VirB2 family protein [Sphingomonas sp.]|nr:TrbC/VirB2 family protein [Sphingomonas sp.]
MADALSTPVGSAVLVDAAHWIQGTLLGTLATAVAVIAVAWIGFGMLSGRINLQRGAVVILGCFVVFGAPVIAAGLMRAGDVGGSGAPVVAPPAPPTPQPTATPAPYDPYAGASVPVR